MQGCPGCTHSLCPVAKTGPHWGLHPPGQPPSSSPSPDPEAEAENPPSPFLPTFLPASSPWPIYFMAGHTLPAESHEASEQWDWPPHWTQRCLKYDQSLATFLKNVVLIPVLAARDTDAWRHGELWLFWTLLPEAHSTHNCLMGLCSLLVK